MGETQLDHDGSSGQVIIARCLPILTYMEWNDCLSNLNYDAKNLTIFHGYIILATQILLALFYS